MTSARLLAGLACVCACGVPARSRVPVGGGVALVPGSAASPTAPASPSAATRMVPARAPLDEPIAGPPNGASLELATTPDGSAALTTDADGGVRLWPTLDGHREPRAVAIAAPVHAISIIRSGAGFLVAAVDDDRALTLTQLDGDGHAIAHRTPGGDPAVLGTAAFTGGLLAWANDQSITWFGADGATRGRLATLPGERLLAVAARGERVIALVEVADSRPQHRVRAVVERGGSAGGAAATALAWGDVLSGTFDAAPPIAVSASGDRIAFVHDSEIVALAVASHQPVTSVATDPSMQPAFAFFDDDHLAVASRAAPLQWLDGKTTPPPPNAQNAAVVSPALAPGPGVVVALAPGGLALATPRGDRALAYLGYRLVAPSVIAEGSSGIAALADSHGLVMLVDRDLRERGQFEFSLMNGEAPTSLAWLGGDDWLVAGPQLQVVSAAKAPAIVLGSPAGGAAFVRAEPSAHLAATAFGLAATLLRWDPDRRQMAGVTSASLTSPFGMIVLAPTVPALAGGARLVRVDQREVADVAWYADDAMKRATGTARVAAVLAVDQAARVYAWTLGEPAHIGVFANGHEVGALGATTAAVVPEPSGAHVAAITDTAVELYDGGKLVWSRRLEKPHQIAWLGTDQLAVLSDRCVTRLDAATGTPAAHRCGWGFGIWPSVLQDTEGL